MTGVGVIRVTNSPRPRPTRESISVLMMVNSIMGMNPLLPVYLVKLRDCKIIKCYRTMSLMISTGHPCLLQVHSVIVFKRIRPWWILQDTMQKLTPSCDRILLICPSPTFHRKTKTFMPSSSPIPRRDLGPGSLMGIIVCLRGCNIVQNQQPQQAPEKVASPLTKPRPSRDGARPSETLAAQQAFGARLSRTARVEGNTQAGNTRPAQQTHPDRATL